MERCRRELTAARACVSGLMHARQNFHACSPAPFAGPLKLQRDFQLRDPRRVIELGAQDVFDLLKTVIQRVRMNAERRGGHFPALHIGKEGFERQYQVLFAGQFLRRRQQIIERTVMAANALADDDVREPVQLAVAATTPILATRIIR